MNVVNNLTSIISDAIVRGVQSTARNEPTLLLGAAACSAFSKSEIVLPACKKGVVFLVLDVDSDQIAFFDSIDEKYLGEIIKIIENL